MKFLFYDLWNILHLPSTFVCLPRIYRFVSIVKGGRRRKIREQQVTCRSLAILFDTALWVLGRWTREWEGRTRNLNSWIEGVTAWNFNASQNAGGRDDGWWLVGRVWSELPDCNLMFFNRQRIYAILKTREQQYDPILSRTHSFHSKKQNRPRLRREKNGRIECEESANLQKSTHSASGAFFY